MKGLYLKATNAEQQEYEIREYGKPLYQTVGKDVGGYIEIVRPVLLRDPFVMVINEEGRLRGLPINNIPSILYGAIGHGQPIVGDVVFMKEVMTNEEPDISGLDDDDIEQLVHILTTAFVLKEKE